MHIALRPSRVEAVLQVLVHGGGAACLLVLAWGESLKSESGRASWACVSLGVVLLMYSATAVMRAWRRLWHGPQRTIGLTILRGGGVRVHHADGSHQDELVQAQAFVAPWLIALTFSGLTFSGRAMRLWPDSFAGVHAEDERRALRVSLRMTGTSLPPQRSTGS